MKYLLFYVIFLLFNVNNASFKSYSGYQVIRTKVLDDSGLRALSPLYDKKEYDFWSLPREGRPADIMTSPDHVTSLKDELTRLNLQPSSVLVPDVAVTIEIEKFEIERRLRNGKAPPFDRFLTFDEIQSYLDEVVSSFPEIASVVLIGSSHEGRPLRVLKLSNGPGKQGMFFDSVLHAREWAGPPVALYAINQLTTENRDMLDLVDFYFLPVTNPDGYVYTWTTDRLWRKTRCPNPGSNCIGTDPNRNFDWQWGDGNLTDPCSLTFHGSGPFSEVEVASMANFLRSPHNITLNLALHSYGQSLIFPWGGTSILAPNHQEMLDLGRSAADAVREIRGTNYVVQPISAGSALIYSTSTDWCYGGAGIPLTYTIELPGGGSSGFELPASEILPVAIETWEALKVFAVHVAQRN